MGTHFLLYLRMVMKRSNYIQKIFAIVFTAIVLFTVTVRETHYLFAEHHAVNEHCENHLHSQEEHAHCSVCKFDVLFFTDEISHPSSSEVRFFQNLFFTSYHSVILLTEVSSHSLRGPPLFG